MSWPCVLMPKPVPPSERKPGMMWFARPEFVESVGLDGFSPNYRNDWAAKRPPLTVCLPGGSTWCPDRCPDWGSNMQEGWKVTGEPPHLTAHPSIGKPDYHGWLKDGVLSDDLEGRTYPATTEPKQ